MSGQGCIRRTVAVGLGLVALGGVGVSLAQNAPDLDLAAIAARENDHHSEADDLVAAALGRSREAQASATEVASVGEANLRRVPALTSNVSAGPVDFGEILAGANANLTSPRGGPMLVAFASLSMPEDSLKRMIADVTRAGGVIVFRGFPAGNPLRFAAAMQRLVEPLQAASVLIDPRLFRAFAIEAVPTYVAVASDYTPCDSLTCVSQVPPFDRLTGNVTARFALESFASAQGPGAPVARAALVRLEGRP